jgi:uncharacterized protein (DUF1684 family)
MRLLLLAAFLTPALAVAADAGASPAASDYAASLAQWRATHEAQLKADDGWLTVVGLEWIKNGESTIGSNPSSTVVLPKSAPDRVGILTLNGGKVRFKPAPGLAPNAVMVVSQPGQAGAQPAHEMELKPDLDPTYTRVVAGRVKFFIIQRGEGSAVRFGVRIKDNASEIRRKFTGLHWYAPDPSWRITAQYIPFDKPRDLTFDTLVGVQERDQSPGYVQFERNGKQYRMDAVLEDDDLWFVMRDSTSGKTTYAASRFLYTELPKNGLKKPGPVVIDFNKAENPPCVFTPYATCPLPPPQNRLTLAVTAGEQMYAH